MSDRLEALRRALVLGWGELCTELGIKRSMLHYLRSGEREASPDLLRRIISLEQRAGLAPAPPAEPSRTDVSAVMDQRSAYGSRASRTAAAVEALSECVRGISESRSETKRFQFRRRADEILNDLFAASADEWSAKIAAAEDMAAKRRTTER